MSMRAYRAISLKLYGVKTLYVLIASVVLSSCAKLDNEPQTRLWAYGTAYTLNEDDALNYFLLRDDGKELHITENHQSPVGVIDGQRVKFTYDILSEASAEAYNIKLYTISDVLEKKLVFLKSEEDGDYESWDAEMGNDYLRKVDKSRVWFSGRYLNVEYTYLILEGLNKYPILNLVAEQGEEEAWTLTIRCNANGNVPSAESDGIVFESEGEISFDLLPLFDTGNTEASVTVAWSEYESSDWSQVVRRSKDLSIELVQSADKFVW